MDVEVFSSALDRVAAERRREFEAAIERHEWRLALEASFTSLIWRAIALALRQQIASPPFDPTTNPVVLARRLRADCNSALNRLSPSEDKGDLFHKVETLAGVLDGILDVVGALEAWSQHDPREAFFLSVMSMRLGQSEVELGFAESGFWEQVAEWRAVKKAGRSEGWTIKWRKAAAPFVQEWIDSGLKGKALINKLWAWLEEYKVRHRDEKLPDYESLRKALDGMNKSGLIRLPKN